MAQTNVREATGPYFILTSSSTIKAGDLLYVSSGAWALADADSHTSPAEYIALNGNGGSSTARVAAARVCKLYDEDAPWTAGSTQYLSGTAGAITETRPTAAARLRQVVGRAVTTKLVDIEIGQRRELHIDWHVKGATSAFAQLDSGDYGGPTLDAQNEVALLQQTVPENAVGVVISKLRVAAEASAGTPTGNITVSGNVADDTQWDAVTADATLTSQATEGTNPDAITEINLNTGLDATNIIRPGSLLGMRVLKNDAGTDIIHILGGHTVYNVFP
jgi:hypothetical protein